MSYCGYVWDRQWQRWRLVCQGSFADCWSEVLACSDGERHGRAVLRSSSSDDDNPQGQE